jgi:hypothetical protein
MPQSGCPGAAKLTSQRGDCLALRRRGLDAAQDRGQQLGDAAVDVVLGEARHEDVGVGI